MIIHKALVCTPIQGFLYFVDKNRFFRLIQKSDGLLFGERTNIDIFE